MPIVSTGQFTIVDNNDARPITAVITSNGSTQQIYTKDESSVAYVPDWTSTPLTLTAKVYVGGTTSATDVTADLTNRKWSTDLSTSLGSNVTYNRSSNLTPGSAPLTYYFEGDYTDPVTGLVSHVVTHIVLSQVKTGTNAVFISLSTPDGTVFEPYHPTNPKTTVTVDANLMRAAGIDNSGVTYRWFQSPHAAADQIDGNLAGVTTKYGFQDTAAINRVGVIGQFQTGSGTTTNGINTTNSPDGGWVDAKSLVIHHSAVTDLMVYKVEAKDSDGVQYQTFFTITDVSDPYEVTIVSSAGDKFQNGVGSTTISPTVYYGATKVASLTGWTFTWYLYDRNGNRGGFIDTTRTAQAGGRNISASTTGTSAVFTYDGTSITFAAGDIIKVVHTNGNAYFYEVASGTGNTVTIRTPSTNTWLSFTTFASPGSAGAFIGGRLYVCMASGTRSTSGAASFTLTGDEIDAKGSIFVDANRP